MKKRYTFAVTAAVIGVFLISIVASSQGVFDINWHTIDGGGGVSKGSTYSVHGTVGQPEAQPGISASSGVTYTVNSGFWVTGLFPDVEHLINLPLIQR
jgi:hypothetical protein